MLWQERGVVNTVVVLGSSGVGLGVYRRRRGGRNSKYGANKASQKYNKAMRGARGDLTQG